MQPRNLIRLLIAVAALVALAVGVSTFHSGGDIQTPGNLVRASLVALALIVASLGLEIGRAVDDLAIAAAQQEARLRGYEYQIERDAERVRKLWAIWQVVACLIIVPAAALMCYFSGSLTAFIFGTPDTRFMVTTPAGGVGMVYCLALGAAIQPVRFALLLLLAKVCPLGAARVASQQETAIYGTNDDDIFGCEDSVYIPMSRIAYFRLFSALLAAALLLSLYLVVTYVRVTDQGIGLVDRVGTTEVFRPWTEVVSITETTDKHERRYAIRFSDASDWRSDTMDDAKSRFWQSDPREALILAASRAGLPLRRELDPYRYRRCPHTTH